MYSLYQKNHQIQKTTKREKTSGIGEKLNPKRQDKRVSFTFAFTKSGRCSTFPPRGRTDECTSATEIVSTTSPQFAYLVWRTITHLPKIKRACDHIILEAVSVTSAYSRVNRVGCFFCLGSEDRSHRTLGSRWCHSDFRGERVSFLMAIAVRKSKKMKEVLTEESAKLK